MTTIGGIGIGFYLLGIVWVLAIVFFVVTIPLRSNLGWIGLASATLFTIVLIIIPTESSKGIESDLGAEKDYSHVYRYLLLATLLVSVFVSSLVVVAVHCATPIRPKAVPSL